MASRDYPDDFVDKALELAAAIGIRPAARQLSIPVSTLDVWTKQPDHLERWAELRRVHAPKWRARAAITMEQLVDEYALLEAKALEKAKEALPDLDPRDVANFVRSIAVAKGVTADHVGKLRGQPTQIVEHTVNAERLEAAMAKLLEEAETVEGTATELPAPAEIEPAD